MYDKLGNKDVNVLNVDLIVGKDTEVVDKQPRTENHSIQQNGGVDLVTTRNQEFTAAPNHEEGKVIQSVEDIWPRTVPVKDMEMNILKGGNSSEDVVIDNFEDGRVLNFRTKSVELDIKAQSLNVDF